MTEPTKTGPLAGVHVLEFAGLGPGPMAAMLLADLGATVLRIENPRAREAFTLPIRFDLLRRGRSSIALDLKDPRTVEICLTMMCEADCIIEGFRPGTMEKLGLGPAEALARNPALVYGRVTGWGQEGPLAASAGHDINYIGLSGALAAIGRKGQLPAPPLALVGDFGGGGLYLAFGIVSALLECRRSGKGQVVDAAMIDGAASLMTAFYGMHAAGEHTLERGTNLLDSGSPFYDVYACGDGKLVAVGAVELRFRVNLLAALEIDADPQDESDVLRERIAARFRTKPRAAWNDIFGTTDACYSEVLDMAEAPQHPHLKARGTFIDNGGVVQPAPAPRFSRTPPGMPAPPSALGVSSRLLEKYGITAATASSLARAGVIDGLQE